MANGLIRNKKYACILKSFGGLCFERNISPTDIDGFLEFNDAIYIFIEIKFHGVRLAGGQRLALQNLVDVVGELRDAILIVAEHNVNPNTEESIDVANCLVVEYRVNKKWARLNVKITVRNLINTYKKYIENKYRVSDYILLYNK